MQERIFTTRPSQIISRSFFIWLYVLLHVAAIAITPKLLQIGSIGSAVLINVVLACATIPGLIIFFNYYNRSIDREFILRYNTISLRNVVTNEVVEIYNPDIERIELVSGPNSRAPWNNFEFIRFTDKNGKEIIVTMFMLSIIDIWTNTLSRRIDSNKMTRTSKTLPIIK